MTVKEEERQTEQKRGC